MSSRQSARVFIKRTIDGIGESVHFCTYHSSNCTYMLFIQRTQKFGSDLFGVF